MHASVLQHPSLANAMGQDNGQDGDIDDLTCIHWGYLNVLQLNDVTGKKIKHPRWQTFWTDLCGSTLRLYRDTSLPESNNAFPPSTMIGPRPESQIKYAFFSLKNGNLKDCDGIDKSPKLSRKQKIGRKHVLQIILSNFSIYFLQAPTMSSFYRWRTKLQSSIDHADADENFYDKQLRDAKMAIYEQQRICIQPTHANDRDSKDGENVSSFSPPCDPRVAALKEKLQEKRQLLIQLENQERDFLGADNESESTVKRIEFSATASKNYFLCVGRHDTLIPEGQTFTVFGLLPNGRWRCFMDKDERLGSCKDSNGDNNYTYPLIGSVPSSVIVELNQPCSIKDYVDSLSVSSNETSPPGTPADDLSTNSPEPFTFDGLKPPSSQSSRRSSDGVIRTSSQASQPEPYSNHRRACTLPQSRSPVSTSQGSPTPTRPTRLTPSGNQAFTHRVTRPSDSSMSPTSPQPQSVSNAISDLNRALDCLAALRPRSRVSSNVSTSSRTSNSSQEDESSDMSRGSRIELVSDDESTNVVKPDAVVRRRKKRDIHISRKLHAKGISIIVGSSSSSEDEDDCEEVKITPQSSDEPCKKTDTITSRKIGGLHSSKEKLTEKDTKAVKSSPENTSKLPNGDRAKIDIPTTTTDLLREFSENGCYGEPIRNSVTQAQFKPLASHEIPPPLHQRRTLQMTREENEGFGFVLQTNTIIQTGAYSDSMTFISNVSEDGPAYLAGMRPGDVIIEVENVTVEDESHQMIVEKVKNAGLTVRLVVVYKDAIRRIRLSTKLFALKARLGEAENAYDACTKKENMIMNHVKDPSAHDIEVRMEVVYIYIVISSATFARDTAEVKDSVNQIKRTPSELLQEQRSPECGASTTGYDLVREFATSCEPRIGLDPERKATSPKYASDTALNMAKKKNESSPKHKTLKLCQRSSFVSYISLDETELDNSTKTLPDMTSRRRVKSDGYDPDDSSDLAEKVEDERPPQKNATLPAQKRPESYMIALGSQNALDTSHFRNTQHSRIDECDLEDDGFV
ncbi:uncharacterized protein LOC114531641 [Dendronephthya gigantea]|uniref:uncharacterized protein LOC114531641 n=1 Tax=Dendronephthya gigantea TaxID=151771 RepID=UPI00106ABB5C|nr:uncharacterized protein LOC114531641 [Dendronephthya gigantea]XP_028409058.1 uncharacterized protein LOC114531641 [Dendronephthya gigantea]